MYFAANYVSSYILYIDQCWLLASSSVWKDGVSVLHYVSYNLFSVKRLLL